MAQREVRIYWDEANTRSATRQGVNKEMCSALVRSVALHSDIKIWRDNKNSKKEMYGGGRYVCIIPGANIFICFVIPYMRIQGMSKAVVRVIAARPVSDREPILREISPERFTLAPSIRELLWPFDRR